MPRLAGRAILLKFKTKGHKKGKFDPVATFGKHDAFSGYRATTKGKAAQRANEYSSLRNDVINAFKRFNTKRYSDAKRTRKKKALLKRFPNYSAVRGQINN